MLTVRRAGGIAAVVLFAMAAAAVAVAALVFNPRVSREDAYGAADRARGDERLRLANAQVESDPPLGLAPGPRLHRPGTLARLRYETFDTDGARLDAWEVRALIPPPSKPGRDDAEYGGCPAECQGEMARGAVRVGRPGIPGIAPEWILRMPLNQTFDLGRQPLTTQDILDARARHIGIRMARRDGAEIAEPSRMAVTLVDACEARVSIARVSRLEFFPDAIVPVPRGFRTYRWLQIEGCGPLTNLPPPPEPPPAPRPAVPAPAPEIRSVALRRSPQTGWTTLDVDESWFVQRPAPVEFVLRDVCRYDVAGGRWTRVPMPHENISTRIDSPAVRDGGARTVVRLPEEIALFWIRWVERNAGDRSARNQTLRDTLATSGPVLCEDISLGPTPLDNVPACVPFRDRAAARFVADPRLRCGQ